VSNPPQGARCPARLGVLSNAYDHCSTAATITLSWGAGVKKPVTLSASNLPVATGYTATPPTAWFNTTSGDHATTFTVQPPTSGVVTVYLRTYFPNRAVTPANADISSPYATIANRNLNIRASVVGGGQSIDVPFALRYSDPRQGNF